MGRARTYELIDEAAQLRVAAQGDSELGIVGGLAPGAATVAALVHNCTRVSDAIAPDAAVVTAAHAAQVRQRAAARDAIAAFVRSVRRDGPEDDDIVCASTSSAIVAEADLAGKQLG